jgi:AraC family transcriptional regulator of adaptative response/methylated-DNA-[protein]-cysteine methyltransferase
MMVPPRRRGAEEEIRFAIGQSSLGAVLVASSDRGVVSISIGKNSDEMLGELQLELPGAHLVPGDREDKNLVKLVVGFIERPGSELDLPLDIRGTAFQRKVWRAVQEIPLGETSTYTEVAKQIGAPKAMRAVGSACANNKLALVIPCHRVLRSDGSFVGGTYWNKERQEMLMNREAAARVKRSG